MSAAVLSAAPSSGEASTSAAVLSAAPSREASTSAAVLSAASSTPSLPSVLPSEATASDSDRSIATRPSASGLEPLVPSLEGRSFSLQPGPRPFLQRLAFSPGGGRLGEEPLYVFRVSFNPSEWLGWEAHLGHNRGRTVHALFHMLNAHLRYPVPYRVQPYLTAGFGVVLVFPGTTINADPVTKNALGGGAGLEFYLRDDVALRGEWRRISVFARDPYTERGAVYDYGEVTLGVSFYRRIGDG